MTIPRSVFYHIQEAVHVNHGAQLKRGNKTYSLSKKNGVQATLFVECTTNEMAKFEKKGYTVVDRNNPLAWKSIPLSRVPDSTDSEWKIWDEY